VWVLIAAVISDEQCRHEFLLDGVLYSFNYRKNEAPLVNLEYLTAEDVGLHREVGSPNEIMSVRWGTSQSFTALVSVSSRKLGCWVLDCSNPIGGAPPLPTPIPSADSARTEPDTMHSETQQPYLVSLGSEPVACEKLTVCILGTPDGLEEYLWDDLALWGRVELGTVDGVEAAVRDKKALCLGYSVVGLPIIDPTEEGLSELLSSAMTSFPPKQVSVLFCGHGDREGVLLCDGICRLDDLVAPLDVSANSCELFLNCCYAHEMAGDSYIPQVCSFECWYRHLRRHIGNRSLSCIRTERGASVYIHALGKGEMSTKGNAVLLGETTASIDGVQDTFGSRGGFNWKKRLSDQQVKNARKRLEKKLLSAPAQANARTWSGVTITMFDGQHGDSTLVSSKRFQLLCDGGNKSSNPCFMQHLLSWGLKKLNCVVLTHADMDHVGGLLGFFRYLFASSSDRKHFKDFSVAEFIGQAGALQHRDFVHGNALQLLLPKSTVRRISPRCSNRFCENKVLIVLPSQEDQEAAEKELSRSENLVPRSLTPINKWGISFVLLLNGKRLLFTGDALGSDIANGLDFLGMDPANAVFLQKDKKTERFFFDYVDIPHHGSDNNETAKLLLKVSAKVLAVSTNGSRYGHPGPQVLSALREYLQANGACSLYFNHSKDTLKSHCLKCEEKCDRCTTLDALAEHERVTFGDPAHQGPLEFVLP